MEFWPENQGQSSLYSKFGTVPGRNCAYNYHDRHQAGHYPLYYGEQQDQSSVSSYWTAPGSRTAGAPQEYTNWTDQEPAAPTSSHFPFILDRHPQQHQDLGEYQPHEAREWTAAQRAAREYERGFLREGWQRRWEPCSPVRYNREVSAKRSDSSYRELEAWAARYSHSLPRRRRIEAELRGASQGLLESSRAPERESRSGTDPRVAALQQVIQSANIRESGLWDRGGRQQAPTYYPPQTPATDTSHMLDMKEKIGYQRRMFSQPPGYIAPPPYNSPHKSSPALHHSDPRWEQEGKRQTYWSQPTLRKQDVPVDHRKVEREDYKPDVNQYTFAEPERLNHRRQEPDALQASSPISIQQPHIQHEDILSLPQQPQVLQAVENKKINEVPTSKVIEGRKFRLNKKTGGMTIFCLVSRLAGTTETPSLPLCTSQTNIQNAELGEVSKGPKDDGDNQTHKLADEVDFRVPTPTEQPNICDARNLKAQQTTTSVQSESLKINLSNKADTDVVSTEKANDADSTIGRQVAQSVQPVSVKYPLWREPSFTSKAETESLKANSEEDQSDVLHNQEGSAELHPIDIEVRRLDIKEDTESEDSKGLLVIDTTCVVVKMELIPSPKKEHVHFLDSTPQPDSPLDIQSTVSPECVESNSQLDQDVTTDQNTETDPLLIDERPETDLDSDLIEKKAPEEESEISPPAMSPVYEKETLEERAERILGIPLHDSITEQQPEDATSPLDSCVEDQEVEPSPVKVNEIDDAAEEIQEDEQSQNQLAVDQTEDAVCLQENDDAKDQVANEGGEDFAGSQEQMAEENDIDSQLETDIKASPETEMTEDPNLKSGSEGAPEQTEEDSPPVENDSSLRSPTVDCEALNPALSLMLSSPDVTPLLHISESNTEEGPDPELIALNSAENLAPYPATSSLPHTPSQQSPLPPGSDDLSQSSTALTDHSPSPCPLDLINQTVKPISGVEDQDEEGETSQLLNNETDDLAKDMTERLESQKQFESSQPDDVACVNENKTDVQQTTEANKDPSDNITEQALEISQENASILQQQPEIVPAEDVCVEEGFMTEEEEEEANEDPKDQIQTLKIATEEPIEVNSLQQQLQSYITEDQLPQEASDDPTGLLEQAISQENVTESHPEVLQQQFDNDQEEVTSCLKKTYLIEEQPPKEANEDPVGLLEQTISQENVTESQTEVIILQQQLECVQTEDACMAEEQLPQEANEDPKDQMQTLESHYVTEEQLPKEANEDPAGLLEQIIDQENVTESQTEVIILQQHFKEGASCVKETYLTEELLQKEADEDPAGLLEPTTDQENVTESQTEVIILQQHFKEGASCVKETYLTEELLQKEADEDPAGLLEPAIDQENVTKSQTEVIILQQQFKEGASCVKETYLTEELLQKEADEDPAGLLEPAIDQENVTESQTEVIILQQHFKEGASCVKETYLTEELLQKEADEDPAGLLEPTIDQENVTESQTEVIILQQQFKEGASCVKETYLTEEQLEKEADEDPAGLLEQTVSKQNAAYAQTQMEIEILQDTEPQTEPSNSSSSPSNCEVSQLDMLSPSELLSTPSHKSDTEFVCLLDSVCPSALNPVGDAAPATSTPETVPPPLHSNSCEESLHFLSSSESPSDLLPCTSTYLLQDGSESVSSDLPLKEEPQYPKSLWDAVNRIRKHTAPDSENEEEEVNELWDPESVGEDLRCADVAEDMDFEKIVFDEAGQQEVSTEGSVEGVEVGKIQRDQCHKEPSGHAEEDALSCCSASSHGSGDTVIVADEDEFEERESETVNDEEFQTAEREQCCSGEVKDETADKGEDDDGVESVTDESSQREECPFTVVSTTNKEVEMLEKEQKGKEVEVFVPSEVAVADEQMIKSESVE